jgi:hypothetical protein
VGELDTKRLHLGVGKRGKIGLARSLPLHSYFEQPPQPTTASALTTHGHTHTTPPEKQRGLAATCFAVLFLMPANLISFS